MSDPIGDSRPLPTVPPLFWVACLGALALGVGLRLVTDAVDTASERASRPARLTDLLRGDGPPRRVASTYFGLGAWVDAFDFDPAYRAEGAEAPLTPADVDGLAAAGVRTLYLQASRRDDRATGPMLDVTLLAVFLMRAHAHDIAVVGWYLPKFDDLDADLARLLAIAEFDALDHGFDGIAVDIEFIEGVADPVERSARLVELSTRLREALPGEALGAIVPPAVQLEVVNPSYWPSFPWRPLEQLYDVWLPMTYWTTRSSDTPYRDAFTYTEESTRRMRANLGRADVAVHPIGGIGDATTEADLDRFAEALTAVDAVGGSIYDWVSLAEPLRARLAEAVP